MKDRKLTSVKEAAFRTILKSGVVFISITYVIIIIFILSIIYFDILSNEKNLVNILTNNIQQKEARIVEISNTIAKNMDSNYSTEEKNVFLQNTIAIENRILGILILDKDGVIVNASSGQSEKDYSEFIGMDFSGKEYYNQVLKTRKTYISNPYVQYKTRKLSINIVSPIIKDDEITGMCVVLISPNLIENERLENIEYYIVCQDGDIIFKSYQQDLKYENSIFDFKLLKNLGENNTKTILYKNSSRNKYVLSTIKRNDIENTYIIVEYDIFGNKFLLGGIVTLLLVFIIIVSVMMFAFSARLSAIVIKNISIFSNMVKNIAAENYEFNSLESYQYKEIKEIIDNLFNMADKIKQREEELTIYNEELIDANKEISVMLTTISENERIKKEQYMQIMWTLVKLIEIKDEYTAGHSKNVTYYAKLIAERLSLSDTSYKDVNIDEIEIAALLHDIGKIGIDRKILNKPNALTEEEFKIIKTHPEKGYYALREVENLKEERKMVRYHHERYDGKGYPQGLKGEKIPLGARIISVADSFDAMVSDRPYRKGMPLEKAVEQLVINKGTQFDPLIVDVFLEIIKEDNAGYDYIKECAFSGKNKKEA
ncbi:HD domain-containing phosphohydrolase [Clostridium ganghwense]|uniref:HD domain-containing protein n=1 Tax=Clostridium ganghwense TaxID=312089 RepID=A0ABT4CLU6_9CLOT|nr:HD domain-containing phosphohydrolase [Clostridium ganghwense]MCY6370025.1 HD domain-containing protein [Clostridium ganghwense]